MDTIIENNYTYHAPTPAQGEKLKGLREHVKELAYRINQNCPASREKSLALTKLEEVIMWANASIVRDAFIRG